METKDLIRECIMLPAAMAVINESIEQMKSRGGFLQTLHGHAMKVLYEQIVKDYRELSRELRGRGYTIVAGLKEPTKQVFTIRLRGCSDRTMTVPADSAKRETDVILERYVTQLERDLEQKRYAQ